MNYTKFARGSGVHERLIFQSEAKNEIRERLAGLSKFFRSEANNEIRVRYQVCEKFIFQSKAEDPPDPVDL